MSKSISEMMNELSGSIEDSGEGNPADILSGKSTFVQKATQEASPAAAPIAQPAQPAQPKTVEITETIAPEVLVSPITETAPTAAPIQPVVVDMGNLSVTLVGKLLASIDKLREYDGKYKTTSAICKFLQIQDKDQEAGVLYKLLTLSSSVSTGISDLISISRLESVEQVYSLFELDKQRLDVMCDLLAGVSAKQPTKTAEKSTLCREVQTSIAQVPKEIAVQLECIFELIKVLQA
jgi:hypothetical protein